MLMINAVEEIGEKSLGRVIHPTMYARGLNINTTRKGLFLSWVL